MTVKEVFELRKQGRIEEAYESIRPMYAAHKGRYTTLCMFWTAADVFKLRLDQKRYDEAEKILEALKRMLPRVEEINKELDSERSTSNPTDKPAENSKPLLWGKGDAKTADDQNKAAAFIASATCRLAKVTKKDTALTGSTGEKKKNPERAPYHSRGCEPTEPKPTTTTEPRRGDTSTFNTVLIDSVDEKNTTNSQLLHDYPGHLIVSLDEGIIRPIEGINAPQRVVLACITAHPGYYVPQISASTGIPAKSIERHVSALIDRNLIEHRGSKKTGGYFAINETTENK